MAVAAHAGVYTISADDITYVTLSGLKAGSPKTDTTALDVTAFDDGQYNVFIQGLKAGTISLEMNWLPSDAGQVILRSRADDGATFYVKALFDGTNGFKYTLKAFSFSIDAKVADTVMQTTEVKIIAAPSALP
tara:strand:+ start:1204 stop:1602 length:399 start_codon:yes stop_codon:yes gene_type:complete